MILKGMAFVRVGLRSAANRPSQTRKGLGQGGGGTGRHGDACFVQIWTDDQTAAAR